MHRLASQGRKSTGNITQINALGNHQFCGRFRCPPQTTLHPKKASAVIFSVKFRSDFKDDVSYACELHPFPMRTIDMTNDRKWSSVVLRFARIPVGCLVGQGFSQEIRNVLVEPSPFNRTTHSKPRSREPTRRISCQVQSLQNPNRFEATSGKSRPSSSEVLEFLHDPT